MDWQIALAKSLPGPGYYDLDTNTKGSPNVSPSAKFTSRGKTDMDWTILNDGEWIVLEAYEVVDPTTYADVWKDQWLMRYTTALMKKQWGTNLTKFTGLQLPGGVQFNGEKIYDDATAEVDKLETEMINSYSLPVLDMVG